MKEKTTARIKTKLNKKQTLTQMKLRKTLNRFKKENSMKMIGYSFIDMISLGINLYRTIADYCKKEVSLSTLDLF